MSDEPRARAERNRAIEADSRAAICTRCVQLGLPLPVFEHRFDPRRRWRFDLAWPQSKIALEFEGGLFSNGRHTRGSGYTADLEKYNEAALAGWTVLRVSHQQVRDDTAALLLERAFAVQSE